MTVATRQNTAYIGHLSSGIFLQKSWIYKLLNVV